MDQWHYGQDVVTSRGRTGIATVKDNLVFAVGAPGACSTLESGEVIDLTSKSPWWKPTIKMIHERQYFGVGVINDYLYAVGGYSDNDYFNSTEVFDYNIQEWRMVSSMATRRSGLGVGVLNNLLYAVGTYVQEPNEESLNISGIWINSTCKLTPPSPELETKNPKESCQQSVLNFIDIISNEEKFRLDELMARAIFSSTAPFSIVENTHWVNFLKI
ncbi:kelch-like protein diablo [Acyrthosiphon pisum]|uniref:Uncharacterized protein n=1 Tax=Acyrthosiphon pisum TaxID=7029 RepID=A0A8R2NVW7_ACYPI|nr:kelch-like protein diablo [Acyrthosiphon pisum]